MYEYHGWLTSNMQVDADEIEKRLIELNEPYPASARYVNGQLHISFSGNPNRELDYIEEITNYLLSLNLNMYGIIYINSDDTDRYDRFDVIKVVNDRKYLLEDKNFSLDETRKLLE